MYCNQCEEQFCEVCYHNLIHRTGKRKTHTYTLLHPEQPLQTSSSQIDLPSAIPPNQSNGNVAAENKDIVDDDEPMTDARLSAELEQGVANPYTTETSLKYGKYLRDRCRYIPLRLLPHERQLLHLLTAALSVSEYTSRVDILPTHVSRTKRMVVQLKQICAILSGLVVAYDFRLGQEMLVEREFADNAEWFQSVFEIGRRYKIQNPDGMRGAYGMMMYMIQVSPSAKHQSYTPLPPERQYLEGLCAMMLILGFDEFGGTSCIGIQPTCPIEDYPCISK